MNNNILDYKKIQSICKQIDNSTSEIFDYVIQFSKLVETVPALFQDEEIKKICDLIQNEEILKIKSDNDKIMLIETVLSKVIEAYDELDRHYSNIKIFE